MSPSKPRAMTAHRRNVEGRFDLFLLQALRRRLCPEGICVGQLLEGAIGLHLAPCRGVKFGT